MTYNLFSDPEFKSFAESFAESRARKLNEEFKEKMDSCKEAHGIVVPGYRRDPRDEAKYPRSKMLSELDRLDNLSETER